MLRMDDENDLIDLNYGLQPKYFVDRITYFKGLAEKSFILENKKFFNSNSILIEEDFKDKIKGEEILNKYYSCAFEKLIVFLFLYKNYFYINLFPYKNNHHPYHNYNKKNHYKYKK